MRWYFFMKKNQWSGALARCEIRSPGLMVTPMKYLATLIGVSFVLACSVDVPTGSPDVMETPAASSLPRSCARILMVRPPVEAAPLEVSIAGDFEAVPWTGGVRLRDEDGDGVWHGEVTLAPGRYAYRLVIDEVWVLSLIHI